MEQPVVSVKCDSCGAPPPHIAFRGRLLCGDCYPPARAAFHARRAALESEAEAQAVARQAARPLVRIAPRIPDADTVEEALTRPVKKPNWLLRVIDWVLGFDGKCEPEDSKGGSSDDSLT